MRFRNERREDQVKSCLESESIFGDGLCTRRQNENEGKKKKKKKQGTGSDIHFVLQRSRQTNFIGIHLACMSRDEETGIVPCCGILEGQLGGYRYISLWSFCLHLPLLLCLPSHLFLRIRILDLGYANTGTIPCPVYKHVYPSF